MPNTKIGVLIILFLFLHIKAIVAEGREEEKSVGSPGAMLKVGKPPETNYGAEDSTTATKTNTPLTETPQSTQVINRDVIEDQGSVRLQDTIHNVSGAVPGDSTSNLVPFLLRGFRAEILRDGFTLGTTLFLNIFQEDPANVERIEVLKGPASVLYGNAAPGGIINVITKKPLPYFYASAEMTAGSFSLYRPAVDVSAPLNPSKTLLFRLNASYLNSDSFRDFISSKRVFVAPALTWRILANMTLTLDGEYFRADQPPDEGLVAIGNRVADIPFSRNLGEPTDEALFQRGIFKATLETEINESFSLRNAFQYNRTTGDRFDHFPVALLPDNRTLARIILDANFKSDIYTTQHDLTVRVKTGPIRHELLFGIEYTRENFDLPITIIPASPLDIFNPKYGNIELPHPLPMPSLNLIAESNSLGVYIQDQITVLENLHVLAGVRFDRFDQDLENTGATMVGNFTTEKVDSQLSPRFGIVYEPIHGISLYTNYSKSFHLLLSSAVKADGSILDPESSIQYEGGVKLNLWDGRLSSTVSVYRIIAKNALASDPINGPVFSVQVDKERSQGFELDLTAQPLRGWNIIASYAYTDAEVRDDDFFEKGNELAAVPKHSGSVWMTYRLHKGVFDGLGFGAGLIAVGKREGDLQNTFRLDGFIRLDAALYYDMLIRRIGKIEASINFKNITDTNYTQNSALRTNIIPGEPFTVLATLRLEF